MMKSTLTLLLCALVLFSCKKNAAQQPDNQIVETKSVAIDYSKPENLIALYKESDSLLHQGKIDTSKMRLYIENATEYALKYPSDTLCPAFLYFAGVFQMQVAFSNQAEEARQQGASEAVAIFNSLIAQYPDYQNLPNAYYYKAQIYENLGNTTDAEKEYRELVRRYPKSDIGKSTAEYLKVGGFEKSADEIWEEIQKKNSAR